MTKQLILRFIGECRKSPSMGSYDAGPGNRNFQVPTFSMAYSRRKQRCIHAPRRLSPFATASIEERGRVRLGESVDLCCVRQAPRRRPP
jgi:hypothetical protein